MHVNMHSEIISEFHVQVQPYTERIFGTSLDEVSWTIVIHCATILKYFSCENEEPIRPQHESIIYQCRDPRSGI
jgi:hypothetical protein